MTRRKTTDSPSELNVEEIRDFYDSVYYADTHSGDERIMRGHYLRLLQKLQVDKGSRVLDVACGAGGWLKVCADNGMQVAGIDLSSKAISLCQQLMPGGQFHAQPAETLPFGDNEFDLVTCLGSLEHFVDPESSLREMRRVAKSDAIFLILVPNKDFLTRRIGLFSGTYQVDAKEVVRSLEDWARLFSSAGLSIDDRWKDLHVANRQWITQGRFYMWPLRALQCLLLALWPLKWQYQVYHLCRSRTQEPTDASQAE